MESKSGDGRRRFCMMTLVVAATLTMFSIFSTIRSNEAVTTSMPKDCVMTSLDTDHLEHGTISKHYFDPRTEELVSVWNHLENETMRLLPNVFRRTQVVLEEDDIVLVSHLGISKLPRLLYSLQQWTGPASIAVYLPSPEDIEKFVSFYTTMIAPDRLLRTQVSFHLMVEKTSNLDDTYPHNFLREMVLDHVPDGLFYLQVDVDVVMPSPDNYKQLHKLISAGTSPRDVLERNSSFLVLPVFDWHENTLITDEELAKLPRRLTKEDAIRMANSGEIVTFHQWNYAGYGTADYGKWLRGFNEASDHGDKLLYEVKYQFKFEPYVLGKKSQSLPDFWKKFRGMSRDKYTYFQEANCVGFRFFVLRDFFLLHLGHPRRASIGVRPEMNEEFGRFQHYLQKRYANSTTCYVEPGHRRSL